MTYDKERFYIFDCNNKLVGNPFGYKKYSHARAQTERKGYSIHAQLMRAFNQALKTNSGHTLVHSIKLGELL